MRSLTFLPLIAVLAAITLAACQQQPEGNAASSAAAAATASTTVLPPSVPASARIANLPRDHTTSGRYKIAITLPTLPAGEKPLADALRTTADNVKREFMQSLPDPDSIPESANPPFELLLDFKIAANTQAFTSVRETGMQDTGGAHPLPVQAAFVFDRKAGKLIALDDLFTDPNAARKALANFAHDSLLKKFMANAPKPDESSPDAIRAWKSNMQQMLNDGTQPTTVNYSVFVVRAGNTLSAPSPGLTLIFPPYQVAPYVFGTQTVDVPASVFATFLKPTYADAFAR